MHLFYTPTINSSIYSLDKDESMHCIRVMRMKSGDTVYLTDGKGCLYKTIIIDDNWKNCTVEVSEIYNEFGKRFYKLHIAIAPTKNIDRFEWFVEKATEIGIDEITPLICEHSERINVKLERLHKIMISAAKQSIKAYLPKLNEAIKFNDIVCQQNMYAGFIAHCSDTEKKSLKNIYKMGQNALILIGPEGDFSEDEIVLALKNNFTTVSLGNSVLRTETAGVVACNTINLLNLP